MTTTVPGRHAYQEHHRKIRQERNGTAPLPRGAIDANDWDNGSSTCIDPGPRDLDSRDVLYARVVVGGVEMASVSRKQLSNGTLEPLQVWAQEVDEIAPAEARQYAYALLATLDRIESIESIEVM